MIKIENDIIEILKADARISTSEIADRLQLQLNNVEEIINKLEMDNVILGYRAIVDEEHAADQLVRAIIEVKVQPERDGGFDKIAKRISKFSEVKSVYLMSGGYDLILEVEGASLQKVASYVSSKLSTMNGVISTSTHFLLKKYKESGHIYLKDENYERLKITP